MQATNRSITEQEQPTVDLAPSAAVSSTEAEMLLGMTCEDVVNYKAREEAKRTARLDSDSECEGRVPLESPPANLVVALDVAAQLFGRSRRLVEKCLIYQGCALLLSIPEVVAVNKKFCAVQGAQGTYGGLSDLVEQLRATPYRPHGERVGRVDFHGARKVISKIEIECAGLGMTNGALIASALMLSLTTTENPDLVGAVRDVMPEVDHFIQYVRERSYDLDSCWRKVQSRLDTKVGNLVSWRHKRGIVWVNLTQ